MTIVDLSPAADGYAEILQAAGDLILLSLNLDGARPPQQVCRVYFAVTNDEEMLFASDDAGAAVQRFDALTQSRPAIRIENYLEHHPSALPSVRGESFRHLVAQLSHHLLHDDADRRAAQQD